MFRYFLEWALCKGPPQKPACEMKSAVPVELVTTAPAGAASRRMPKVTAEIARFAVPAGKSLPGTNPSSAFVREGSLPSKRLFCVTTASVVGWHSELRSTVPAMTCEFNARHSCSLKDWITASIFPLCA